MIGSLLVNLQISYGQVPINNIETLGFLTQSFLSITYNKNYMEN